MKRRDALAVFARLRTNELVISSVGNGSAELFAQGHEEGTLYNIEMPYPTPLGLGLAMALPSQKVVVLDGDGSLLAGLGGLCTVGNQAPKNLVIMVGDKAPYARPGGLRGAG